MSSISSTSTFMKVVVASLLVAMVNSFTTAPQIHAGLQRSSRAANAAAPTMATFRSYGQQPLSWIATASSNEPMGEKDSLFSSIRRRRRRRRQLKSLALNLVNPIRRFRFRFHKRRRALGIALAALVWMRAAGGGHMEAHATATTTIAAPAAIEKVERGGGGSSLKLIPKSSAGQQKASSMNGKMAVAVAGTFAVAPSAGFLMNRSRKLNEEDDDDEADLDNNKPSAVLQAAKQTTNNSAATATTVKPSNTKNGETAADLDAMIGEKVEQKKKVIVEKVLKTATNARQKVDSKTYMQSLQKEKSIISTALKTLKENAVATAPAQIAKSKVVPAMVKPIAMVRPILTTPTPHSTTADAAATKSELPLMSKKYITARSQPKSLSEEKILGQKYGAIADVGDRAYQILVDLGMVEESSFAGNNSLTSSTPLPDEDEEPFQ